MLQPLLLTPPAILAAALSAAAPLAAQAGSGPLISEFLASNGNSLLDQDGHSSDWIEIYNSGAATVDLGGWFLTDDEDRLDRWQFPVPSPLPPRSFLIVFASGKDRAAAGQELHANFKLDAGGEYLALVMPDGRTVAHEYAPEYPGQELDVSYGVAFANGPERHVWFLAPTPGAPNGKGDLFVAEVWHAPAAPGGADDLLVQARLSDPLGPSGRVRLQYRVNYGAPVAVPMRDDGLGGDPVAGDGIWTAVIPESASLPGEMVRYFIEARDGAGRTARSPAFRDPLQSPEYYGTMVADPSVVTPLPVLYWFAETPLNANFPAGTRCSLWYRGEFYDNVWVHPRGSPWTTAWKKKHYKFDFNPGCFFRLDPRLPRYEEVNINNTWSDKAYVRQALAWETYAAAGCPGSIGFPLRVQQNGAFFSVAIFVEEPDVEYLERQGLDELGALYKMYNELTSASWGVEKITRTWEPNMDLQALISGILQTGQARTTYLFDNVDIPQVISYIAATALVHDNDHIAKNYYLYRDTRGDGEWLMLPWDKDLTFGRNFTLTGGVLNDTMWADHDPQSHPLFGDRSHPKVDGPWNRLIDAMHGTPEIQELYLRRLRTLMDELLQAPGTPAADLRYENRIEDLYDQMAADVALDAQKWGLPTWGTLALDFAAAIAQLENEYLAVRRTHFYTTHGPPNNGIIPAAQSPGVHLAFGAIEHSPQSGNQKEEFIEIVNRNAEAVDVSDWQITGGVSFTFAPGTVVGSNRSVFVSPDLPSFRARQSGPSGGQGLLAVGPYFGELAPNEVVTLLDRDGWVVNTTGGPVLLARNLTAGEVATFQVAGTTPGASQVIAYSLTGGGPTYTQYGTVLLSPPIRILATVPADWAGVAVHEQLLPPGAAGRPVWLQAYDKGTGTLTNGLAEVIQ